MGSWRRSNLVAFSVTVTALSLVFLLHVTSANHDTTKLVCPDDNGTAIGHEIDASAGYQWCHHQTAYREGEPRDCCDKELEFDDKHLISFLSVFVMIAYGALVRSILRATGLPIPYTVILMISGLCLGFASSHFCDELEYYTEIARTPPKVILFLFLPVLIFESAFSIPVHTFMRSSGQILVAAFPGMVISTFATAGVCMAFLSNYNWTFVEAALFGSIISATDPVAVVAILRELGTSEMLSVMIEGESLLNDGVAILFYEIFEGILLGSSGNIYVNAIIMFFRIAVGGPIFGWVMAKIAIFCLSRIFNDETVEVTITLVAAYLTYFVGEHMLGVSGVMACVALGLTMSSERTCISPEVEHAVHHFWEMLGYLANTVLFIIVGIIISESAINDLKGFDIYYVLFLYVGLNIIRFAMLIVLYPILARIGYGLKWENMIIMMWGGLRGAVGLCLALEVYSGELCEKRTVIGPSFLFQTSGIVVLTLLVNGTTTKKLLQLLHLTDISLGRIQDMEGAHKSLVSAQIRTINTLKHDRFFADSNWDVVVTFTSIVNPYLKKAPVKEVEFVPSIISVKVEEADEHFTQCPQCQTQVEKEPTYEEMRLMTEEARCRLIKALKISFWKQFERGVLLEESTQILSGLADEFEDRELKMIHTEDLQNYWVVHGFFGWLRRHVFRSPDIARAEPYLRKPANIIVRSLWWIATKGWFLGFIFVVIIANIICIICEFVIMSTPSNELIFIILNGVFVGIYLFEYIVKVGGLGFKTYYKNKWDWIDFIVLVIGVADLAFRIATRGRAQNKHAWVRHTLSALRILRAIRIIRLPRYIYPRMQGLIERRINRQLFLGYDLAHGFVSAIDEVLKRIHFVSNNKKIVHKLKHSLELQRSNTIQEMDQMQRENPGIAVAVKTRHASRAVLNQMRDHLVELNEDGLMDEKAHLLLTSTIEEMMKKLWHSPSSIAPSSPEVHVDHSFDVAT